MGLLPPETSATSPTSHHDSPTRRSVFANCFAILIARSIWAVSLFAATPIIVSTLGAEVYGLWEALLAVGAAAVIVQSVVGSTLLWQISQQVSLGNIDQAKRLVQLGATSTIVMFLLLVPLAILYQDQILHLLRVPDTQCAAIGWLVPATVGLLALSGLNQTLISALAGSHHSGSAAAIQVTGLVVATGVSVAFVICGGGIVSMWLGTLAGFLVTCIALFRATRNAYNGISLVPVLPRMSELAVLAPFAFLLLTSQLALLCRDHLDKVVLTAIDSASSAAYLAIAQRLTSIIIQVTVVIQLPLAAAIGSSYARGDWKNIVRTYDKASHWLGVLACLAALVICTLRTPLLIAWFGHDIVELHGFLAATVWATAVAVALTAGAVVMAKGIGRPGLETSSMLVTLLLTIGSKPLLIWWLGPFGAVLSSAGSWGIGSVLLLLIVHRKTDLPANLLRRNLLVTGCAAVISMITWNATSLLPALQQRYAAALTLVTGTFLLCILYWGVLSLFQVAPDFHDWVRRLGALIRTRRQLPARQHPPGTKAIA